MHCDPEGKGADDESQGGHSHRTVFLDQRPDQDQVECSHHRTTESKGNADQGVPSKFQLIKVTVGKQEDDSNKGPEPLTIFRALKGDLLMILSTTTTRIGMVVTIVAT